MARKTKRVSTRKVAPKGNVNKGKKAPEGLVMPIGYSVLLTPSEMKKKSPEDFNLPRR